uniref:Pentatricopeptide repeat-containing protein n=1 Tax=Caenorhabditis tropicalis TaxID=1561998 RepID=A0A1I7U5T8_9PELO
MHSNSIEFHPNLTVTFLKTISKDAPKNVRSDSSMKIGLENPEDPLGDVDSVLCSSLRGFSTVVELEDGYTLKIRSFSMSDLVLRGVFHYFQMITHVDCL